MCFLLNRKKWKYTDNIKEVIKDSVQEYKCILVAYVGDDTLQVNTKN